MSTHRVRQIQRLHRLRLLEEERDESALRTHQLLHRHCLDAIQDCDVQKADASRALHASLQTGDRDAAMAAEMAMAFDPLRRTGLSLRVARLEDLIEESTASWKASRTRRRQMEIVLEKEESTRCNEALLAEQKSLDGWFLMSGQRPTSASEETDESFQRQSLYPPQAVGAPTAKGGVA